MVLAKAKQSPEDGGQSPQEGTSRQKQPPAKEARRVLGRNPRSCLGGLIPPDTQLETVKLQATSGREIQSRKGRDRRQIPGAGRPVQNTEALGPFHRLAVVTGKRRILQDEQRETGRITGSVHLAGLLRSHWRLTRVGPSWNVGSGAR